MGPLWPPRPAAGTSSRSRSAPPALAPPAETGAAEAGGSGAARVVLVLLAVAAAWGVWAMQVNASGDNSVPLGPVGTYSCQQAVRDAQANVPAAVAEAQAGVDDLVADNPELAPYAADAKAALADAAPAARQGLAEAGRDLGC